MVHWPMAIGRSTGLITNRYLVCKSSYFIQQLTPSFQNQCSVGTISGKDHGQESNAPMCAWRGEFGQFTSVNCKLSFAEPSILWSATPGLCSHSLKGFQNELCDIFGFTVKFYESFQWTKLVITWCWMINLIYHPCQIGSNSISHPWKHRILRNKTWQLITSGRRLFRLF